MPDRRLELVSPERFFAPEMGGMNHVPYMRAFHEKGVADHHQHAAEGGAPRRQRSWSPRSAPILRRAGARSAASTRWWSSTAPRRSTTSISRSSRCRGTWARSTTRRWSNGGSVFPERQPEAGFTLLRIGDCVASRNIHAAIYDGIRYGLRI